MKISIVTACYNAEKTIADAMESVKRQKLPDGVELEHLIVDGGSTDSTVGQIKKFAEQFHCSPTPSTYTFRWLSEKDNGMYDAINKGIRMASGEVVGILNADDVLADENVIAKIAAEFAEDVECVYGKVYFVKQLGGRPIRRCFAKLWRPWMLQWGYMPPHPAIFVRKECFEKWGGYVPEKTEYRIAADYELLIRFFRVNRMRAKYVKLYTTVMRTGGVSTKDVEARKKLNQEIVKANRANGYFCCWPMLLPKYAVKIWEYILPRFGIM